MRSQLRIPRYVTSLSRLSTIISLAHYNPDMAAIVIGRAYLKRARARDVACHGTVAEYVPAPPSAGRNVNGAARERGVTENTRETNESALVTFSETFGEDRNARAVAISDEFTIR